MTDCATGASAGAGADDPEVELLRQAEAMLDDGASMREAARTLGVTRKWMSKHFRGRGWTFVQGGEFRALQMWGPQVDGLTRRG